MIKPIKTETTDQEIMDEYFETNHYRNSDGTEVGEETSSADDAFSDIRTNVPSQKDSNDFCYEIPSGFNCQLKISAIVKVLEYNLNEGHLGAVNTTPSLTITGIGMSPTITFFPVEVQICDVSSEKISLYKPGTILVAEGDYGLFESGSDMIISIFDADITFLGDDVATVLEKNFKTNQRSQYRISNLHDKP